jgi:hypothetical protein
MNFTADPTMPAWWSRDRLPVEFLDARLSQGLTPVQGDLLELRYPMLRSAQSLDSSERFVYSEIAKLHHLLLRASEVHSLRRQLECAARFHRYMGRHALELKFVALAAATGALMPLDDALDTPQTEMETHNNA